MKFCVQCGSALTMRVPDDDNRLRAVCTSPTCEHIHYENPKVIVGALVTSGEKILLCKRAIEPRYGYWTLPAGFMECEETSQQGAERETWEEACAKIDIQQLYRVYDIPHISQVYVFYLATLKGEAYGAGTESLESQLFDESQIPWKDLAFTVVDHMLKDFLAERKAGAFTIQSKVIARSDLSSKRV